MEVKLDCYGFFWIAVAVIVSISVYCGTKYYSNQETQAFQNGYTQKIVKMNGYAPEVLWVKDQNTTGYSVQK